MTGGTTLALTKFTWSVTLLLITIGVAEGTSLSTKYQQLKSGQNITGKNIAKFTAVSVIDCSRRCLHDEHCFLYQFEGSGQGNCILILTNSSDPDGETFEKNDNSVIYEEVSKAETISSPEDADETLNQTSVHSRESDDTTTLQSIEETTMFNTTWIPPVNSSGPDAALYYSFDSSDGFVLMEGNQEMGPVAVMSGQVNNAWSFNRTRSQWVDLGIHTEACMTLPETCGATGGAISLWVNLIDCHELWNGIVSSHAAGSSGSVIDCKSDGLDNIRFHVVLRDGYFDKKPRIQLYVWIHIVLNYIGSNDGQGVRMFLDEEEKTSDTSKETATFSPGDDRIVVGRYNTDQNQYYASVQVDELIFFNQILTQQEINALAAAP